MGNKILESTKMAVILSGVVVQQIASQRATSWPSLCIADIVQQGAPTPHFTPLSVISGCPAANLKLVYVRPELLEGLSQ